MSRPDEHPVRRARQDIYLLEVNPRASRTVPFVSKAIGVPLAKLAARSWPAKPCANWASPKTPPNYVSAKEVVLPFIKFPGVDILLGPEMRSTGEVMGIDRDMGMAFAKSQIAAGNTLPTKGTVFLSVNDRDKEKMDDVARGLHQLGFHFVATRGTAARLRALDIPVQEVCKVGEGRPNIVDVIINGEVDWIINTPLGLDAKSDEKTIRRTALERNLPTMTTLAAARAGLAAIQAMRVDEPSLLSLQEYHAQQ
jgi:carbamoyl-phosphate synthase large subunit